MAENLYILNSDVSLSIEDQENIKLTVGDEEKLILELSTYVPVGGGLDLTYTHTQSSASALWTITHNLGKRPSCQIFDSAGDEVEGNIRQLTNNSLQITFSAPFSGVAYLN